MLPPDNGERTIKYTGKVLALILFLFAWGGVATAVEPLLLRLLEENNPESDVVVDVSSLEREARSIFALPLLDDRTYTAVGEMTEVRTRDDWSWKGRLYLSGQDVGPVYLTGIEGKISGLFYGLDGVFALTPVPAGHRLVAANPASSAVCGLRTPKLGAPTGVATQETPTFGSIPQRKMIATVDLVTLYTRASRDSVGGTAAIRSLIQNAVDATNGAFQNSQVDARVRLVHVAETSHREAMFDMADDLIWLTTDREVARLRRVHRGDLVALIVDRPVRFTAGIAWGMFRPFLFGRNSAAMGYSVTARGFAVGNLSFAHELGHNLGLHHNPEQGPPPDQAIFPYAFGHSVMDRFRTVMGTSASCDGCLRVPNYSHPGINVQGLPTGIPDRRDNHRTLNQTARVVSRYSEQAGDLGFRAGAVVVDEAAGVARVEVFRLAGSIGDVSVEYATEEETATAGSDFSSASGVLGWADGEAVRFSADGEVVFFIPRVIEIPLLDDPWAENDETFLVRLSNPGGGAELGDAVLTVTVANDDTIPPPDTLAFEAADRTMVEGGSVEVTVSRTGTGFGPVKVEYRDVGGTAQDDDYLAVSGILEWEEGEMEAKSFSLTAVDDARAEGAETVALALMNPTGNAVLGVHRFSVVTVEDEDALPAVGLVEFAAARAFVREGDGEASLTVTRTAMVGTLPALTVRYTILADSTATPGEDHGVLAGSVSFEEGAETAEILVPVVDDPVREGNETVHLELAEPFSSAVVLSILDDDGPGLKIPAELVACDEARLEGLLRRLTVTTPSVVKAGSLNLTFTRSGDFAGLAYTGDGPVTPEAHLAFSTNPEESPLLRNPARNPLASVSLTRYPPSSDFVPPGDFDGIEVRLNPTLDLEDPDPETLLALDNRELPFGRPTDSKPGRGLVPLAEPCHALFSNEDQHLLRVLARVVRSTAGGDADSTRIALFRGQDVGTYRINLYPEGLPGPRLAVLLDIESLNGVVPSRASLRVLPACGPGDEANCTTLTRAAGIQLVPPTFDDFRRETGEFVFLGSPTSSVDLAALLAVSTWRRPGSAPGSDPTAEGGRLTPEEVVCDQRRLTGLLGRAAGIADPPSETGLHLSLTRSGDFAGLLLTAPGAAQTESLLAFSTNPEETTLLRNPQRPQLVGISLSRNPLSSDLTAPPGQRLGLTLNPTLDLEDPNPANLLRLNNRPGDEARASDAKPGRGLVDLVAPCHRKFSARDVRLLQILTRIVRAKTEGAEEHRVALFRDEGVDSYRLDVLPVSAAGLPLGRLAARLEVTYQGDILAGGALTLLPACETPEAPHCTRLEQRTELRLAQPTAAGEPASSEGPRVWSGGQGDEQPTAAVDWGQLLARTNWN